MNFEWNSNIDEVPPDTEILAKVKNSNNGKIRHSVLYRDEYGFRCVDDHSRVDDWNWDIVEWSHIEGAKVENPIHENRRILKKLQWYSKGKNEFVAENHIGSWVIYENMLGEWTLDDGEALSTHKDINDAKKSAMISLLHKINRCYDVEGRSR